MPLLEKSTLEKNMQERFSKFANIILHGWLIPFWSANFVVVKMRC